ncbi:MAG: hypothetical protein IMZ53_17095 [Thermoplasmata archaeon]|nr:hypothetical protein [Thermoplasmata archaeon]MBE3142290.1 hypothetical protein [Thermoplasmata archaeon]
MEMKEMLGRHVEVQAYGVLEDINTHGIRVKITGEQVFIAFTDIKKIRLDRRYKGEH